MFFEGLLARPACIICICMVIIAIFLANYNSSVSTEIYADGDDITVFGRVQDKIVSKINGKVYSILTITDVSIFQNTELCKQTEKVNAFKNKKAVTSNKYIQLFIDNETNIKLGSYIYATGKVKNYSHATNQGEFDSYNYYHNRGYLFSMRTVEIHENSKQYSVLKESLFTAKVKIADTLDIYFDDIDATILKGMLLGMKKEVDSEVKETFQKNGIAHILAISGLHISFLCMGLFQVLTKTIRISLPISVLISEIFLVLYIAMVGFSPSAFRAGIMFSMYIIAIWRKRAYDLLTAMSISLIIILSFNYYYIYDIGCQLSYAAILAVGFYNVQFGKNIADVPALIKSKAFKYLDYKIVKRIVCNMIRSAQVSIFVFVVTLPILLYGYYEVALYSVILNLIVVPLMSVLLGSAIFLIIFSCISSVPCYVFAFICKAILTIYKESCIFLENTGFGRRNMGRPELAIIILYYAILTFICTYSGKYKVRIFGTGFILCLILMLRGPYTGPGLYMLDVGQGDGLVFINDNKNVYLFDGGSTSKKAIGEKIIIPFLKCKGVNEVKAAFISHPDKDHMNGIIEVFNGSTKECIHIKRLYVYDGLKNTEEYEGLIEAAKRASTDVIGIERGYALKDKDLSISCIYPYKELEINSTDDTNNTSLVLKVDYKDFTMLETGDIESLGELNMLRVSDLSRIDLLKVSHHGSKTATTNELLGILNPRVACISVGENNTYGHPHEEVLDRLEAVGAKIYRTDESGQITINLNREMWYNSIDEYSK